MLADVSPRTAHAADDDAGVSRDAADADVATDAPTRERYLETVERETRRLERIVQDLLDLARLEGGGGTLEPRLFAIERVFSAVVRRHERELTARQIVARHVRSTRRPIR